MTVNNEVGKIAGSWFSGRNSNPGPPKHEGVLTSQSWHSVKVQIL